MTTEATEPMTFYKVTYDFVNPNTGASGSSETEQTQDLNEALGQRNNLLSHPERFSNIVMWQGDQQPGEMVVWSEYVG